MDKHLVYSALKTPDGTILESLHRHDYTDHTDKNGKYYMIDGGLDYIRCSDPGDSVFITHYDDEPIEVVREFFHWGKNYDKNMKRLPATKWVKLKDMSDDHLKNVFYPGVSTWCNSIFEKEILFRYNNKINVKDE